MAEIPTIWLDRSFGVSNFKFIQESGIQKEEGDYFFVPSEKLNYFQKLIG